MSSPPELELEVQLPPAHYAAFSTSGGVAVVQFAAIVYGWAMTNGSSSSLATINVYDGADHSGTILFPINLAANQSGRDWFGDNGILFKNGVYLNVTAQSVSGAVFYRRYWPS